MRTGAKAAVTRRSLTATAAVLLSLTLHGGALPAQPANVPPNTSPPPNPTPAESPPDKSTSTKKSSSSSSSSSSSPPPVLGESREARIRRLEDFYARVYGEPLNSTDRLPREIAIVSLARIDAAPVTERLLDAFKSKDRDPVIQYLAWEALHARHASLSPEQRRRWAAGGLKAASAGAFPEGTAAPLLLALAEHHPTPFEAEPAELALRVVRECDLRQPTGRAALDALRHLVAAWREPRMVRVLIAHLNKKPLAAIAARIDHVLRGLPDAPPAGDDPRKAWNGASGKLAKLQPAGTAELKPYAGKASVFPPPAKITDPDDPRWRAELEISALTVSDFDLVWCIDSTGSMNGENQLVARETGLVLRVCALVSRRARCGTIYFRHETERSLMLPCCERAAANRQFYQVKGYPLTPRVDELSAKMAAERIPAPNAVAEGNVHPGGAVHAAVKGAMEQMPWSKERGARKAIVLVGDSPFTAGSEQACAKLMAEATARGFQVHALVKDGATRNWRSAVESAGGETFPFLTPDEAAAMPEEQKLRRRRRLGPNADADPRIVFGRVAATVIRASVTPPYRDRVDPLVKILLAYAEAADRAERNTAAGEPGKK